MNRTLAAVVVGCVCVIGAVVLYVTDNGTEAGVLLALGSSTITGGLSFSAGVTKARATAASRRMHR